MRLTFVLTAGQYKTLTAAVTTAVTKLNVQCCKGLSVGIGVAGAVAVAVAVIEPPASDAFVPAAVAEPSPAPLVAAATTAIEAPMADAMPRLVTTVDGVIDQPELVKTTALEPAAPKNFAPRLLASGDGTPTALPVISSEAQTASAAPAGNFMPRLLTSGREDSRQRRERSVEAAAPSAAQPPSEPVVAEVAAVEAPATPDAAAAERSTTTPT